MPNSLRTISIRWGIPQDRTYGSSGRNAYRGPDRINFNLTMAKITSLFQERREAGDPC